VFEVHPRDQARHFTVGEPMCGSNGCVYLTEYSHVVKFTPNAEEADLAEEIYFEKPRGFPRVEEVGVADFSFTEYDQSVYYIVREAAADLTDVEKYHLDGLWIEQAFEYPKKRLEVNCESLNAALAWLRRVSWAISDVGFANLGITDSGEIVVRDFGEAWREGPTALCGASS